MNAFRVEVGKRKFYRDEACAAFHFLVALPVFSIEIKRKEKRMKKNEKMLFIGSSKVGKKGGRIRKSTLLFNSIQYTSKHR
jgi:hypothetical protein